MNLKLFQKHEDGNQGLTSFEKNPFYRKDQDANEIRKFYF